MTRLRLIPFLCSLLAVPAAALGAEALHVEGFGFSVQKIDEGVTAFGNRTYVFREVPELLKGWQFTRLNGGQQALVELTESAGGEIFVVTAPGQRGVDMSGWERIDSGGFHYTDAKQTKLAAFRRCFTAGQTVAIPQGNWTGCMVAAPTIKASIRQPKPDHSKVPGTVIDYRPAHAGQYIGSPSIARLVDGHYVASHDVFGPGSKYQVTIVFRSEDKGQSWTKIAEIEGQFWSTLFLHNDALYLMGVGGRYGDTIIRRSVDGGKSWTTPKDKDNGILLSDGKYHCAPVPVVIHKGRIWRAMEDAFGPGGWGRHFRAFMMSAPVDADLLKAENWTSSNRLAMDPKWLGGRFGGWLEGNAVVDSDGQMVNILRVDYRPEGGKAAVIEISDQGKKATFDPETGFIDFPGGCKKFTIRFDPGAKLYWSLTNYVPDKHKGANPERTRNTLALISSPDLRSWTVRSIVLHHPDIEKHGFQYVDWLFEDDDIVAVSRTAHDDRIGGARNQHDANYMTFHRVKNFRESRSPLPAPGSTGNRP